MKVNFYWSGQRFIIINRMTIASHIRVGHEVVMWVHNEPNKKNLYWVDDLPVKICKSDNYLNTEKMLKTGWNLRTISTFFQYKFMKKTGEYTADCDAVALKHWPDEPLILCPEDPRIISSVGVLRVPKNHAVLKCAMIKAKKNWGNVRVFSNCCIHHKLISTHKPKEFYPISAGAGTAVRYLLSNKPIPDAYSYHIFTKHVISEKLKYKTIENTKFEDSLLKKIADFSFGEEYPAIRNDNRTT